MIMEKNDAMRLFLRQRRFDLIFKYLYVKDSNDFNKKAYIESIRAFNGFQEESSNGVIKKSSSDFVEVFDSLIKEIKKEGYVASLGGVKVNSTGKVIDGAHRLSICASLGKNVVLEDTDLDANWDYNFFRSKNMKEEIMDYGALEFTKINPQAYVVNLMPVSNPSNDEKVIKILEKYGFVYYKKDVWITYNGLVNLKKISYGNFWERASWVGTSQNYYSGAQNHARLSMGKYPLRVVVFVCDSLEKVIEAKKEIRDLYGIGNFSVHINDTHEEAIQLAETYFNRNSLFLVNTRLFYLDDPIFEKHIEVLKNACRDMKLDIDRTCGAGSTPLNAFQIRHSEDLDYLTLDEGCLPNNDILSSHDKHRELYPYSIEDIITNPCHHLYYNGVKFISLETLYCMKMKQWEAPKNILDSNKIKNIMLYEKLVNTIKQENICKCGATMIQKKIVTGIYQLNNLTIPLDMLRFYNSPTKYLATRFPKVYRILWRMKHLKLKCPI